MTFTHNWKRLTARLIAALWFGWWAFFAIASGIGEGGGANLAFHIVFPLLTFAVPVVIVWRWERAGSLVLLALGVIVAVGYPFMVGGRFPLSTVIFVELSMALPPLAAGALLLTVSKRKTIAAELP